MERVPFWLVLGGWLSAGLLGWFRVSDVFAARLEGRLLSGGEVFLVAAFIGALGFSAYVTAQWVRSPRRARPGLTGSDDVSARRRFLTQALTIGGGFATTTAATLFPIRDWFGTTGAKIFFVRPPYKADRVEDAWRGARVASYRRLGRTEAFVSDISLGSGSGTGGRQTLEVAKEAIERGINYFDTAPDYSEAGSERRLGEAMKGRRDEMFVATKFCLPEGHLNAGTPVAGYIEAVEGSLRRLQTDRVDLVHIHSCDSVERLMDPNVHEAFDRLREQGKVRFLGVSTHTPNLEAVAEHAIESGRFDVLMLAYHFGAWPKLGEIIDRAAAEDIGVVAMKTLRGSQHRFLDWAPDERDSFTQASFKWVLENPSVSCLVISLWESGQLDEFLYASGKSLRPQDVAVLDRYLEKTTADYCRPHCGACLDRCPEDVPIHDVLRHRMYFEHYGAEKEGMRLYASLGEPASACATCAAPCTNACPYGLAIPERVRGAHDLLTLA